jgi:hypothetical protein
MKGEEEGSVKCCISALVFVLTLDRLSSIAPKRMKVSMSSVAIKEQGWKWRITIEEEEEEYTSTPTHIYTEK